MSEYQYYEFVTVDRQLSHDEMDQLRSISTRADISSTRFCNTYNYGDLKAEPERMLLDYFDAFVYVSNFAFQRFIIKLPKECFSADLLNPYFPGDGYQCAVKSKKNHWLLEFTYSNENGYDDDGWVDGEGWMGRLLSIRNELIKGDYRSLYLAWLAEVEHLDRIDDLPVNLLEPSVPAGLGQLTASQSALCEFLKLPAHIVEAAARGTADTDTPELGELVSEWLSHQAAEQCQNILRELLLDETGVVRTKQIATIVQSHNDSLSSEPSQSRTVTDLKQDAKAIRQKMVEAERLKKQKALEKQIEEVAAREPAYWNRLEELFEKRGSSSVYSEIREKARSLKQVAQSKNRLADFEHRVCLIRETFCKKKKHLQELEKVL
ncbi:hypothetical protein NX722_11945 [Endozoicomonas gorgoniicola]|uniref:Uncharacterized protein n=1 Tax=Endozoicomonas gorgoniicola TaxID=1234144 RepID=A0ABT3MVB9_9GAMM|nr:hypothetical protein [Endozoicomonas gorgoniicola]MCW7553336.1 hypothetical protein [Endozoicomonas gorgoniicola]